MGLRLYTTVGHLPLDDLEQNRLARFVTQLWDSRGPTTTVRGGLSGLFAGLSASGVRKPVGQHRGH